MSTEIDELKSTFEDGFSSLKDAVAELADNLIGKAEKKDKITSNDTGDFDVKFAELNEKINNKIADFEQKFASITANHKTQELSMLSKSVKQLLDSEDKKTHVKTVTSDNIAGRRTFWGLDVANEIRPSILDVMLMQGFNNEVGADYTRINQLTNNASVVGENQLKPQSLFNSTPETALFRRIATWEEVTTGAVEADRDIEEVVRTELANAVIETMEKEIITGDGSAYQVRDSNNNLIIDTFHWDGLLKTGNHVVFDRNLLPTASTKIDTVRFAIAQCVKNGGYASGIILNSFDWALFETAKVNDNGTGAYIIGEPVNGAQVRRLWGVNVYDSQFMTAGKAIVGAFRGGAAKLFMNDKGVIDAKGLKGNDFIMNKFTLLAELSGNVAVRKPHQIVLSDLDAPANP